MVKSLRLFLTWSLICWIDNGSRKVLIESQTKLSWPIFRDNSARVWMRNKPWEQIATFKSGDENSQEHDRAYSGRNHSALVIIACFSLCSSVPTLSSFLYSKLQRRFETLRTLNGDFFFFAKIPNKLKTKWIGREGGWNSLQHLYAELCWESGKGTLC